jgi:hypothetical protein
MINITQYMLLCQYKNEDKLISLSKRVEKWDNYFLLFLV